MGDEWDSYETGAARKIGPVKLLGISHGEGGAMQYLRDQEYALDTIAAAQASIEAARYELAALVMIGQDHGLSWAQIGEALGVTRQAASQMVKRLPAGGKPAVEGDEYRRLCRALGIGRKLPRWELRRRHGNAKRGAVTFTTVSGPHLRRKTAEDRADHLDGVELWRIAPDGSEVQAKIRPARFREVIEVADEPDGADDWSDF